MEESVLSLEQILAAISPQKRYVLEQKITDDCHLAEIAKSLTNWKSVCAKLGINEVEEEEIQADNSRLDGQKYAGFYCTIVTGLSSILLLPAYRASCTTIHYFVSFHIHYLFFFYSGWHCCVNGDQKMVLVPRTDALQCAFSVPRDQIWWK